MVGSGKTSLCISLKCEQSRYAEEHDYNETKFMENWDIDLRSGETGSISMEARKGQDTTKTWTWTPPEIDDDVLYQDIEEPSKRDKAQICDTAGHMEYTAMTGMSLTNKSLIMIMFDASKYFGHLESYQQTIGCYVDLIVSSTYEAAIILVAGHSDQLTKNSFLYSEEKKKQLFQKVEDHVNKRWRQRFQKSTDPQQTKIKLIAHSKTSIFMLANKDKYEINNPNSKKNKKITDSQMDILNAMGNILRNSDIIRVESSGNSSGNTPMLWRKLHNRMLDISKTRGNYCLREDAKKYYEDLKQERLTRSDDTNTNHMSTEDTELYRGLINVLDYWSSKSQTNDVEDFSESESMEIEDDSENEIIQSKEDEKEKLVNLIDNDDEGKRTSESPMTIEQEQLLQKSKLRHKKRIKNPHNLAIEYLRTIGDLVFFESFRSHLLPNRVAFVNTCKVFLDHKKKRKEDSKDHWRKGLIKEGNFDTIFDEQIMVEENKENSDVGEMVDLDTFKELLIRLGMVQRLIKIGNCYRCHGELEENKTMKKDKKFLVVPSLINNPVENFTMGRSAAEVYSQYEDNIRYVFEFGESKCFISAGIVDTFLVNLYTKEAFECYVRGLGNARFYKANIERRLPGIVFAIEFIPNPYCAKKSITIIEEEEECSKEFYTNRLITVFMERGPNTFEILEAIREAMAKTVMQVIEKTPETMETNSSKIFNDLKIKHGLLCYNCLRRGLVNYISDNDPLNDEFICEDEDDLTNHGMNKKFELQNACDDQFHEEHRLVVKNIAYAVSIDDIKLKLMLRIILR